MRLWWELMQPDGYGYAWGRSVGLISYADTLEIVGFLAAHPEFRPAPLEQLASAYYQSWRYLRHDYNDKTHMLSLFGFGRGMARLFRVCFCCLSLLDGGLLFG